MKVKEKFQLRPSWWECLRKPLLSLPLISFCHCCHFPVLFLSDRVATLPAVLVRVLPPSLFLLFHCLHQTWAVLSPFFLLAPNLKEAQLQTYHSCPAEFSPTCRLVAWPLALTLQSLISILAFSFLSWKKRCDCESSLSPPLLPRIISDGFVVRYSSGILLCSQCNCYRQAQLRSVGAASIAWMGWCCCCWCGGAGLSDCCISSGHVASSYSPLLSTLSQACPLLSASFQSLHRKGDTWGLSGGVEVGLSSTWSEKVAYPPASPAPLPFLRDSTTSPSQMAAACFHVSVSHSHYGCDTVIFITWYFYCKYPHSS